MIKRYIKRPIPIEAVQWDGTNAKEMKDFSAEESLRLFYVAITRAKKKLYITTSRKVKGYAGAEREEMPSIVFEEFTCDN